MKQCEDCQLDKDTTEFANSRHTSDGLQRRCRPCRSNTRKQNQLIRRQNGACTIYLLTNLINQKIYVGQTWMPLELRMGKDGEHYGNSPYLYNAIQKYGCDNFEYTVLEICYDQKAADELEDRYMVQFDSRNSMIGYNLKEGGSHGQHSEASKAKISQTLKEQIAAMTPEELAIKSAPISTYWLGKERGPHTEEWKQDQSKFMIRRHQENGHPMQGKHHTPEACAKISAANMGHKRTEASIEKGRQTVIDQERDQLIIQAYQNNVSIKDIRETFDVGNGLIYRALKRNGIPQRANHGQSKGKKHSPASIEKMSIQKQAWWDNKKENDEYNR